MGSIKRSMSCPDGWHLPTYGEWKILANYISTKKGAIVYKSGNRGKIGKYLKTKKIWYSNSDGTDCWV
jgi:uncharacterized protein (TIGR02145 family)